MKYSKSMANLYHYVNFQPKEISGFSRLEIQGENVRIGVKLCFPKMEIGSLKLYIIHEKAGKLFADLISEGKMRQRVFTMQKVFSKDDIEKMHIIPEKIKGIYIIFSDSVTYLSFWEKEQVDANKIIINKIENQKVNEVETNEGELVLQEEEEPETEEAAEANIEEAYDVKEESQPDSESEQKEESELSLACEDIEEVESESACEEKEEPETEPVCVEKEEVETEPAHKDEEELKANSACEEKEELVHGYEEKEELNKSADFEKINLMELRKLPKSEWAIANNSFLLHGYYNYHYITMKKEKNKCIIGIPGMFHPKEQQVARYFGFDSFIPERDEEVTNDTFGYWCRSVDINA